MAQAKNLISIIVPVYNAEKYLEKCLNNLLNQTYNNLEIILINDGSTDNSKSICEKFAENNDRIIVINQQNLGVSCARNQGIEKATGEWIAFVDVDDLVELNIFEIMLEKLLINNADICECNYNYIYPDKDKKIASKFKFIEECLYGLDIVANFLADKSAPYIWNKLYRSSIVKNIKFSENISIGEDVLFCLEALYNAKSYVFTDEHLYNYMQQSKSAMHNLKSTFLDFLKIKDKVDNKIKEAIENNYSTLWDFFEALMITRAVNAITFATNKKNMVQAQKYLSECCSQENMNKVLSCKNISFKSKLVFRIIKFFGIKAHLAMRGVYKLMRKY